RLVARPLVGPDEQDVESLLAVPRWDRHVRDGTADGRALGDGGVGRVGIVAAVVTRGRARGRDAGLAGRGRGVQVALLRRVADEDAATVDDVLGQHVV